MQNVAKGDMVMFFPKARNDFSFLPFEKGSWQISEVLCISYIFRFPVPNPNPIPTFVTF